jgi:hypothetical protein
MTQASGELQNWLDSVVGDNIRDGVRAHSGMTPKMNRKVVREVRDLLEKAGARYSVAELRTMSAHKIAELARIYLASWLNEDGAA